MAKSKMSYNAANAHASNEAPGTREGKKIWKLDTGVSSREDL